VCKGFENLTHAVWYVYFPNNQGAGRLKNPKSGSGSYCYLIAIFGTF
jgi:hypothetical protein